MTGDGRRGEFALIADFFAPLAGDAGALGLTDDGGLYRPNPGAMLVVTVDTIIADVHYLADDPPDTVGRKLLAVNLSDLAAMGAMPRAAVLAAAFADDTDDDWIAAFCRGLGRGLQDSGVALIGGDTTVTPGPATFSLTLFGETPEGAALTRGGAQHGDRVFVSGSIGDAALGLKCLRGEIDMPGAESTFLIDRYRRPQARTALGCALRDIAHAVIDVSDGLIADLSHIADMSSVVIDIDATAVPLSPVARRAVAETPALLETILTGGDDYELAVCAADADKIIGAGSEVGVRMTEIGRVSATGEQPPGVRVRDAQGQILTIADGGFQHRRPEGSGAGRKL